jgi:hypothetical protein
MHSRLSTSFITLLIPALILTVIKQSEKSRYFVLPISFEVFTVTPSTLMSGYRLWESPFPSSALQMNAGGSPETTLIPSAEPTDISFRYITVCFLLFRRFPFDETKVNNLKINESL